jgi:hypothetical protein
MGLAQNRRMVPKFWWMAVVVLLASCAGTGPGPGAGSSATPLASPAAERLRFVLVGDAPYGPAEEAPWSRLLQRLAAEQPAFMLHAGDIKGGSEPCSDGLLAARVQQLREPPVPLVLALGDNEWTDCHRPAAGAHLPLERLALLRRLAFAEPTRTLGARPMVVESQATAAPGGLPEHQAFTVQGVRVATLHVVGSRNGLEPWGPVPGAQAGGGASGAGAAAAAGTQPDSRGQPRPDRLAEVQAREAAVLQWLRLNVERATSPDVQALVLLFQANPGLEHPPGHPERHGFEAFLTELQRLTLRLKKPVLLAHGDFHRYLADTPWPEQPWVQRVQTWGSPQLGAVRVRLAESGAPARLRFELESVLDVAP